MVGRPLFVPSPRRLKLRVPGIYSWKEGDPDDEETETICGRIPD